MVKFITSKRVITYLFAYVAIFIYSYFSEHSYINTLFFIKVLGVTSAIYLSTYCGLKLGSIRLRENDRLRNRISKLHVPAREIIIHISLVVVVIVIVVIFDTKTAIKTSPVVENKKIDEKVLNRIEEACGRTDITKIVEINGKYFVTFSDNSKKLLQLDKK